MKEKEGRGKINLTEQELNSTLESGRLFMAENGENSIPKTPEETVDYLSKIKSEKESHSRTSTSVDLPPEWGTWNLDLRRAWIDSQRDNASEQLLGQVGKIEDPHAISPAQQEALDKVYGLLQDDPEAFADSYVRAIDTLSQKRAEPIVHGDAVRLVEQVLEKAVGQIPPESIDRFRKRALKSLTRTPPEVARSVRRIVKDVKREPQRLERKAVRDVPSTPEVQEDTRPAFEEDLEAVYNLTPEALTPEAMDYLKRVSEDSIGEIRVTNNVRKILRQNGVSKELVDKYTDKPEILIAMLVARNLSYENLQRDLNAAPVDSGEEAADAASSGGGDGGERIPPAPPIEPTPEVPEEEPTPSPELSEVEKRIARQQLEREMQMRQLLDPIINGFRDMLGDQESKVRIEEAMSKEAGRPIRIEDPDAFIRGVLPSFKELEEQARKNMEERRRSGEPIYVPQSLEELAQLVMNRATPEYRIGGEKALVNEDGTVNTLHFLDWARSNYFLTHLNNPTTEVSFFSDIATNVRGEGFGGTISFYEITSTESYFLKEVKENGEVVDRVESEEYKALRNQMLMEVFLLQLQRNPAVNYVLQNRAEREKMLNALLAANILNPITRSDFFERIFTQPSMKAKSIKDLDPNIKGKELQAKLEANFAMGTATREALASYINVTDYEMLVKILGTDSVLFKHEYESWDAWTGKRDKDGKMETTAVDVKDPNRREKWFYTREEVEELSTRGITVKEGSVKLFKIVKGKAGELDPVHGSPHPDFMKYINIFLTPTPDQRQQNEIRERMRLTIMERNGLSYREAQIAELMAYSMAHINGVAARNDTDSVAFDWWTRVTNFRDKRKREKSSTRNAPYGSDFNVEGLKRIGLNFFEAARDIRGRSIRKIIQGGEGADLHIQDNPLKNSVDYQRDDNGRIKFVDAEGNPLALEVYSYDKELLKKSGQLVFKNKDGNAVDVGEAKPAEVQVEKVSEPVEFEQDIQKQFLPNHLITASKIYEWIFEHTGYNLPELVIGRDERNNPIFDWKKINEIKHGIDHDMRYMLSTWGKINFGERQREWEQVEIRDEATRRLQGDLRDRDGVVRTHDLDEDYYVLEGGRRTDRRADPNKFMRIREMSRLESMFGAPALVFIKEEIDRKGLSGVTINKKGEDGTARDEQDIITVEDPRTGEIISLNIAAASSSDEKLLTSFRIAVYQGAINYLKAAEIEEHRTPGSGARRYDFMDTTNLKAALILGGLAEPEQVEFISEQTDIGDIKLFLQYLAFEAGGAAAEGILKALAVIIQATVAE